MRRVSVIDQTFYNHDFNALTVDKRMIDEFVKACEKDPQVEDVKLIFLLTVV